MKTRILLIGYNFYPEITGIGKYSGEMIYWLAKDGYDCTVITAYPYYPYWKIQPPYVEKKWWYTTSEKHFASGGKIIIHRCPMYIPAKPSGMKRMILDFSFLISAFFKLLQLIMRQKFNCVFVVAPSFQFGLLGILCKKLSRAKVIYHIQDLQIEAARDMQLIKSERVIRILFGIERYILNKVDVISSISLGMINKIQIKANRRVLNFPNWTDIKLFYPIENRADLKKYFGFDAQKKIILYSGSIGEKQGLEAILEAAKEYQLQDNVCFIICGSGPYKIKLEEMVKEFDLQNVVFFPLQPFAKFNQFLNMADVHLVLQKSNASDLVMPSKLTTILAVGGLALITADEGSSLHSLIKEHQMGLLVAAENQFSLNAAIKSAITEDHRVLAKNARIYAEEQLSIERIMERFRQDIKI
jgi:colanic acid biosynthesis glycosyl transferase WcaI